MPSIATHHVFANMVYNNLSETIQSDINNSLNIYYTFAQSHDYLFYSFHKKIRKLGHTAHHEKTQKYLLTIIKEIIDNHLESNSECMAYLYGVITHYCLDTTCHPYIFYKTGTYYKELPEHHKYRNEHTHIEKHLDAYYYTKYYKKDFYKININKEIIKNPKINKTLENLINCVYKQTYNIDNIGEYYKKSIQQTKIVTALLINDKFGLKNKIAQLINIFTKSHPEYYTTFIKEPIMHYMNLEKKEWNHPCNLDEKYNYSFDELLDISEKKCINIIKKVHKCIYKTRNIEELKNIIQDLDYASGLEIKNNKRMKYFEY